MLWELVGESNPLSLSLAWWVSSLSPTVTFCPFRFHLHMHLMTSPPVPQLVSSFALSSSRWWPPLV